MAQRKVTSKARSPRSEVQGELLTPGGPTFAEVCRTTGPAIELQPAPSAQALKPVAAARPAQMRLPSPAESAAQPAPNMQPPRLIGNTGESGVFVLPLSNPAAGPLSWSSAIAIPGLASSSASSSCRSSRR